MVASKSQQQQQQKVASSAAKQVAAASADATATRNQEMKISVKGECVRDKTTSAAAAAASESHTNNNNNNNDYSERPTGEDSGATDQSKRPQVAAREPTPSMADKQTEAATPGDSSADASGDCRAEVESSRAGDQPSSRDSGSAKDPAAQSVVECAKVESVAVAAAAAAAAAANAEHSNSAGPGNQQVELVKSSSERNQILVTCADTSKSQHSQFQTLAGASHQRDPQTLSSCKRRQLSYLQTLLLRRWPCLALAICIMSSLLFGILLSAATIYLMHGVTDCSHLALAGASSSPLLPPHEHLASPSEYHGLPVDVADLAASAGLEGELGARSSAEGGERPRFERLPRSVWPIHYDLFVQPYVAEPFNFTGRVSIRIKCNGATENITLHSLDLQLNERTLSLELLPLEQLGNRTDSDSPAAAAPTRITKRQVVTQLAAAQGDRAPKISRLDYDKQLQYSIIRLDRPLEVGREYSLGIDFVGTLNDDLAGFYKIRYERPNSTEPTWIAATQFQATDARRAFPCFDEPIFKATYSIQIKHWKNMTALSNMPIVGSEESADGLWVTDSFGKSHKMSTYLVAYAVTNFESRTEGNISVWTRPGFAHTAEYALKIAGKILRHYEDFFGIEYPLPKMDMIALPDFNAGAMENWGLITYRETAMLYDEATSSVSNKQRVAVVVSHELAHQWFGNLVTPKWWDDLWLNEGFASYVEYIGVDFVEPKWRMLDQFVVEEVQNVFKMDGLSSTHQISIPVNNPDEISEIFDHISYAKGASIIRMMNHFLTEEVFKTGLRRYLRALKYDNAEQSDLWAHLTEAQRLVGRNSSSPASRQQAVDVGHVMNSWTLQSGYPLVTLTRDYDTRSAQLSQVRFQVLKDKSANTSERSNSSSLGQKWEIPITLTWRSEQNWDPKTRVWMHQNDSGALKLDSALVPKSKDDWMLLNVQQVGYYRANYDLRNWRLLIEQLNTDHKQIGTTNRAQILDDIFELAKASMINYRLAMEATKYLKSEQEYLPWDTVLMSFGYIDDMLQRTPIYGHWKDYTADLISPYYGRYKALDWTSKRADNSSSPSIDENDLLEQYNKVNAIAWACQVDGHCIAKAKSVFAEWRSSGQNNINPALRYVTYCTAVENGDKSDWDFLWGVYEKEQNASERDRILRALGCSRELWVLARYLDWTFTKSKPIRRQDGAFVFRVIAKNNYGRDVAFNFMRERWSTIKEYYGKTSFSLGSLIRSVSTSMNTQIELSQLLSFYESIKADVGTGKRSFQMAIEEVESNVAWRNRNYKIIEDWLQEQRIK